MVELIKLFSEHQTALIKADQAELHQEKTEWEAEADQIASEISDLQNDMGANDIRLLPAAKI